MHFFLGNDEGSEDSDDESDDDVGSYLQKDLLSFNLFQTIDVKALEHKREINKKTRSGDKKMRKILKAASKVRTLLSILRHV